MPTFRVLSVDAHVAGRDRALLGRLIGDARADLVCIHNGPSLGRWRQRVAALARRAGLVVVHPGGRAAGGNVLLSTLGVDSGATTESVFGGRGLLHPPGAALAVMRSGDAEFVLASATLIGNAAERLGQAGELQAVLERFVPGSPPVLLSAIGIDRPGTAAWQALADGRVPVGARFFADGRIGVGEVEVSGGPGRATSVLAELTV